MSSKTKIKIAVLSDLHCCPNSVDEGNSTYLHTDKLRSSSKGHPVESLLKLAKKNDLSVDLTLCPGDFTDKANVQGLISGWEFSREINEGLKSKNLIATVGNHDVDVYGTTSNYSLTTVKGIKRGFPISNETQADILWSKGCSFVEHDDYRVLVINSSHFHYNKENSCNGKVSKDALDYISDYLSKNDDDKIKIAMSHHPPIPHPNKNLGEDDKIINGQELLNILSQYKFDLFIYGHKHDPYIKYHQTENNSNITLFSSGSFSAGSNIMFAGLRNAFHIIELIKTKDICKGKIDTWTYLPSSGWTDNLDENAFAPKSGFGNEKKVKEIFSEIKNILDSTNKISWEDVSQKIEDINYLIPSDSKALHALLEDSKFLLDKDIWKGPNFIFNTNLLE